MKQQILIIVLSTALITTLILGGIYLFINSNNNGVELLPQNQKQYQNPEVSGITNSQTPEESENEIEEVESVQQVRIQNPASANTENSNIQISKQNTEKDLEITNISNLRVYEEVYIAGTVNRINDEDEFTLEDSTGRMRVYTGWQNTHLVEVGEFVTVRGRLDDGPIREFYAEEVIK